MEWTEARLDYPTAIHVLTPTGVLVHILPTIRQPVLARYLVRHSQRQPRQAPTLRGDARRRS
jgi:hypothetical protein